MLICNFVPRSMAFIIGERGIRISVACVMLRASVRLARSAASAP